jgi:hypothetical protein
MNEIQLVNLVSQLYKISINGILIVDD